MKPEDLIGPAAAKALAEHFDLTPKAKPLAPFVTEEEAYEIAKEGGFTCLLDNHVPTYDIGRHNLRRGAEAFVLRWLRSRLEECTHNATGEDCPRCLVKDGGNASIFKALTGREWKP